MNTCVLPFVITSEFCQIYLPLLQICRLSSEYYHLVPKSGYEYERLPPIDQKDSVEKELCHIDRLLELAVASKMLAGAQYRIKCKNHNNHY